MSSLWTPGGEHPVGRAREDRAGEPAQPLESADVSRGAASAEEEISPEDRELMQARLDELRQQLVSAPAEVVIANHAFGLFELAAMHLSQRPPRLEDARLAVDAMAAIVENLSGRLGEPERSLRDALAQIRLAFVEISAAPAADREQPPAGAGVP